VNCVGSCGRRCVEEAENLTAERLTAVEIPAGLGTLIVDRAETGDRIERDAGPVAALVHAAFARVLNHVLHRHLIVFAE